MSICFTIWSSCPNSYLATTPFCPYTSLIDSIHTYIVFHWMPILCCLSYKVWNGLIQSLDLRGSLLLCLYTLLPRWSRLISALYGWDVRVLMNEIWTDFKGGRGGEIKPQLSIMPSWPHTLVYILVKKAYYVRDVIYYEQKVYLAHVMYQSLSVPIYIHCVTILYINQKYEGCIIWPLNDERQTKHTFAGKHDYHIPPDHNVLP